MHTNSSASPGAPEHWIAAADVALKQLVAAALDVARARPLARCVDGQIIGTGRADFTQGNTVYTLHHQGSTFQLMDVQRWPRFFKHKVC